LEKGTGDVHQSEDLIVPRGLVSDFFAAGMVSAKVNRHYGNLRAAQIEYAPLGVASGLCVGLATTAFQNQALTLQPCSVPATTVWIIDTADSPATAADGYFPLVNGSTRNFSRPFVMDYSRNAHPTDEPTPQTRPPPEAPRQRAHRAGQTALGYSLRRPAVGSPRSNPE
jgi:hypothetical protein